jgi:hypothetical protein
MAGRIRGRPQMYRKRRYWLVQKSVTAKLVCVPQFAFLNYVIIPHET